MVQDYKKPLPVVDEESKRFFDGAKQHKLLLQQCRECKAYSFPFRRWCNVCQKRSLEWVEASGKGEVYTYGLMHYVYRPAFASEVPYPVVIIHLDEGPLITSNLMGCKNEEIKVGMRVEAVFDDVTSEFALPKFRPAEFDKSKAR